MSQTAERRDSARPSIGIGSRVGHLTVIEATTQRKGRYTVWRCKCDCGQDVLLDTRYLQRGTIADCGCMSGPRVRWHDLTGQRFGRLVVTQITDQRNDDGSVIWRCQCDCGAEALVPARQLIKGMVKSCGCLSHPPLKKLEGRKFGRLTVLSYDGKRSGKHFWRCACDCGSELVVAQGNLLGGVTNSCGCLRRDALIESLGLTDGTSVRQLEYFRSNLSCRNKSGHNGVYRNKTTGKWHAQVTIHGKTRFLGEYNSVSEAIRARERVDQQINDFLMAYYRDHPEWIPYQADGDSADGN